MKKSIIILLTFVLTCSIFPSARAADTAHAAAPIDPLAYQQMLGKGMDVDWCKTTAGMSLYHPDVPKDFKQAGISHVRIRVKDEVKQMV